MIDCVDVIVGWFGGGLFDKDVSRYRDELSIDLDVRQSDNPSSKVIIGLF